MNRYGVNYITQRGRRGNAVLETENYLTDAQIREAINLDIAKQGHSDLVTGISVENLSSGASLASKMLITAAKIFK